MKTVFLYFLSDAEGEGEETTGADEGVETVANGVASVQLNGDAEAEAQNGAEGKLNLLI